MKRLLFFICVLFQLQTSKASHVVGAGLTYQCLANGTYEVTFTFYRDCIGIPPPSTVLLTIDNSCGIPAAANTLTLTNVPNLINTLCSQFTTCMGGQNEGIQKCIYRGIITLPSMCGEWILGVSISARNAANMSLVNPDFHNLYVSAGLNNLNNLCNNSPVFENDPVVIVCNGQPYCLNPGGYDSDGDSLVYSLITPMAGPNENMFYQTGFSYDQPLISNPPVTINSTNGELCFNSVQPVYTTYAELIQEYRNGSIIGQVERDIILIGMQCTSQQPQLSGINGFNVFDVSVCAYHPCCFNIYSNDPNVTDSTKITWDNSIAAASLTTSTYQQESALFCWTPGLADIDTIPHCFTVYVRDNSCPAYQTSSRTFCITVHDSTVLCSPVSVYNLDRVDQKLLIYPQPASSFINIDFGADIIGPNKYILTITDLFSDVLYQSNIYEKITELNTINLFSAGVYFAVIKDEQGHLIKKGKFIVLGKM